MPNQAKYFNYEDGIQKPKKLDHFLSYIRNIMVYSTSLCEIKLYSNTLYSNTTTNNKHV